MPAASRQRIMMAGDDSDWMLDVIEIGTRLNDWEVISGPIKSDPWSRYYRVHDVRHARGNGIAKIDTGPTAMFENGDVAMVDQRIYASLTARHTFPTIKHHDIFWIGKGANVYAVIILEDMDFDALQFISNLESAYTSTHASRDFFVRYANTVC